MSPSRRDVLALGVTVALSGCSALAGTSCSPGEQSVAPTDWPLARRDSANSAAAPARATPDPEGLTEQWSTRFDQRVRDPVVADGRVLTASYPTGGGGRVFALDAGTGERQWDHSLDETFSNGPLTPAVADGTVLTVGRPPAFDDGKPDRLYALDAETGDRRWTFAARDLSPPTPAGGVVYVASDEKTLFGLDVASGEVCLEYHPTPNVLARLTSRLAPSGRPAVAGGTAFVPVWERHEGGAAHRRGRLHAFDVATGERTWRSPVLDAVAIADVSVAGGRVFVPRLTDGGSRRPGAIDVFDAATGDHRWTHQAPNPQVTPAAVTDDAALVRTEGLTALDPATGTVRWRRADAGGGHVVGGSFAFARTGVDALGAFDLTTGDPVAETSLGRGVPGTVQVESGPRFSGGRAFVRTRAFDTGDEPPRYRADRIHALG